VLPVDLAANAESLGAEVHRAADRGSLDRALEAVRDADRTAVIYVPVDADARVPGYDSWWDVPVAEVSEQESVRQARRSWEAGKRRERHFL
jgi:3D-(3,5/4)-trihydroxycyclohexane-1,2-dione acylhydrolase (decyclizing)